MTLVEFVIECELVFFGNCVHLHKDVKLACVDHD